MSKSLVRINHQLHDRVSRILRTMQMLWFSQEDHDGNGCEPEGRTARGLPREVMLYLVGNHAQEVILPRESVPHEVTL